VSSKDPVEKSRSGVLLAKGSAWLWLQQALDITLVLVFTSLILRFLGPENFGLVVLVQSVLNLSGLATLNLEQAAIRLLPEYRSRVEWRSARSLVRLILGIKLGLGILVAIALFSIAPLIANIYNSPELVIALRIGCISVFSSMINIAGESLVLGYLRPQIRPAMTGLRRSCELVGLIILSVWHINVPGVIAVLSAADTIVALGYSTIIYFLQKQDPRYSLEKVDPKGLTKRVFNYCLPLYGAQWADVASQNLGKLIVGKLAGATILGYYGVAKLASERIMQVLVQAPLMAVPIATQLKNTGDLVRINNFVKRLIEYQWALGTFINLTIWAASPLLVLLVGGAEYQPSAQALRVLGFALLFWSGTAGIHAFFMIHERTAGNFLLNLTQISITVGLYYLLVNPYGLIGVTIADTIGYFVALGVGVLLTSWFFNIAWQKTLRFQFRQLLWTTILILPVWLKPGWNTVYLIGWFVVSFIILTVSFISSGLPARSELLDLLELDWRVLNHLKRFVSRLVPYLRQIE